MCSLSSQSKQNTQGPENLTGGTLGLLVIRPPRKIKAKKSRSVPAQIQGQRTSHGILEFHEFLKSHSLSSPEKIGRHLGNICTFDGTHVLSTTKCAWVPFTADGNFHSGPESDFPQPPTPIIHDLNISSRTPELPDAVLIYRQLDRYRNSTFGQFFPIIDLTIFRDTVATAYQEPRLGPCPAVINSKVCIFALLSLAGLGDVSDTSTSRKCVEYYMGACHLLPIILRGPLFLESLQGLLLLVSKRTCTYP